MPEHSHNAKIRIPLDKNLETDFSLKCIPDSILKFCDYIYWFFAEFNRLSLASYCRALPIKAYYKSKNINWYLHLSKYYIRGAVKFFHALYAASQFEHLIVHHECYFNGFYVLTFSWFRRKIISYTYPFGLVVHDFGAIPPLLRACDLNNLRKYKKNLEIDHELSARLRSSNYTEYIGSSKIPYLMDNASFTSREASSIPMLEECKYIIYAHSFTDAQNSYGSDFSFLDVKEWLEFTISFLASKGEKFCVKSHPNFYTKSSDCSAFFSDKLIFDSIYQKYCHIEHITWINEPVSNSFLLQHMNKRSVAVSHHGTSLIEAGIMGFKCISSCATTWRGYDLFNTWNSKMSYRHLLASDYETLKHTNSMVLKDYMVDLYCNRASYFHPSHWQAIIASNLKISRKNLIKNASLIEGTNLRDVANQISSKSIHCFP
ncbi:hypothetical protein [Synechococcus sp. WH 8101]|uniref:hypothetical protein n=1 Tax=Synechococcus sp. WH 8101 TaxID=59932 RepID=UPI001023D7F8|nr:hypothetical protein [Synechococcus sp. WH 8101]